MDIILNILGITFFCISAYAISKNKLHMAQLEGYKPSQYFRWMNNNPIEFTKGFIITFMCSIFVIMTFTKYYNFIYAIINLVFWIAACIYIFYIDYRFKKPVKRPLSYTKRAIRLYILNYILLALFVLIDYLLAANTIIFIFFLSIISLSIPFNMLLSLVLIYPFEMLVHERYFNLAHNKIKAMKKLKVIGITGSYGKTSTKFFLSTILREKYNTLMTPENYNTTMGVSRVIREQLNEEHEIFVCEMGARNVGDIKKICKLVEPEIGIITSIGPQHLETFKSIKNVIKTKYELIQSLPYYGTAIFNGDNNYCLELARKTGIETLIYTIELKEEDIYIKADEVSISKEGLKFKVKIQDGAEFYCITSLLGKHNISNLLAAICVALRLGLTAEEIQRGISKIKPVPHRLEILNNSNGVTVIDDAYNSNPQGAKEALETLKNFDGGKKIVITPGMVELGSIEYEENKKFGKVMAECCDIAILVGIKRSKPIVEGLRSKGFKEENIIVVADLNEATKRLSEVVAASDVVLFENDLPDNYNEKSILNSIFV